MLKVIQDWEDRCSELRNRAEEAHIEYQRAQMVLKRALDDEPRVCCTCQNFEDEACKRFKATPPQEFQETPGACGEWEVDVPF